MSVLKLCWQIPTLCCPSYNFLSTFVILRSLIVIRWFVLYTKNQTQSMCSFGQSAWTGWWTSVAKGALAKRSGLTFTLCPFPGRISKRQRPPGVWHPETSRPDLMEKRPTLRKRQPKEHTEPGSTAAAIGDDRCVQVQPPCAPSRTRQWNSKRRLWSNPSRSWKSPCSAGNDAKPFAAHPAAFIREAAEPIEAVFTGDCAVRLPSQRCTKPNRLAASWRRRSTRDSARPGVLWQSRLAAQPPNSPAPLAAQSTVKRNKRRSQAEKEITNRDDSTTITEKINPGRHRAGAWWMPGSPHSAPAPTSGKANYLVP